MEEILIPSPERSPTKEQHPPITNTQKYYNYKEQMVRLKKAMSSGFYLEAIFIEYAVMEDRLESILRHSGVYNPDKHRTISIKLNRMGDLCRAKKSPLHRSISREFLDEIRQWKDKRNPLIHALMKQELHTEELQEIALQGQQIVKQLNSKATNYRKMLERQAAKANQVRGHIVG